MKHYLIVCCALLIVGRLTCLTSSASQAAPNAGSVLSWGHKGFEQSHMPAGNDFVAIAAGSAHTLALRSDGSLVGGGYNGDGQTNVPAGNGFVAIAAGWYHSLALKSDGSLTGWGLNDQGQTNVPVGNDFVAIAAGFVHGLALKADGSLVGWGYDGFGQTDVPAGNDFVAVSAGWHHSLALKSDGSLAAWGYNDYGQTDVPAGNDFVAIAAGSVHGLALRSDGSLAGWGSTYEYTDQGQADVPASNDFVAIAAGFYHSVALKSDGSLVGWGYNGDGQTDVPAGNNFVAIAAGAAHSLAIRVPEPSTLAITFLGVVTLMVRRVRRATSLLCLICALSCGAAAHAARYTVTDLGALNGDQSAGVAINAHGQVTGYTTVAGSVYQHAFVWTPTTPNGTSGAMSDLGTIGGNDSYGWDINAGGQVTGFSEGVAFLWSPTTPNGTGGSMVQLGLPEDRFVSGQAINDSGQVAGIAYPPAATSVDAFLWTPAVPNGTSGAMQDLGSLSNGSYSYGYGINSSGQVVGHSGTSDGQLRAFVWTPAIPNGDTGSMLELGTLGGTYYSGAWDINDAGQVIGDASTTGNAASHAFLYDGTMHDLGTLGGNSSGAFGINASGQVTGYSQIPGNQSDHAFLWTNSGGMVDLNSLIHSSSGWELKIARGINDAGQITGSGQIDGQDHAFLLTPVPEPASLALLVLGLPLLDWRVRRRRNESQPHLRRLRIEPLEERRLLATFMVGNLNDAGAGSLRQAILDANGLAGADIIKFESVAGAIALTSGEMEITEAVAIDGPGEVLLTIDAGENSRILNISALTGNVALNGLTLTGGRTTGENVDFYDSTFNGGAIRSLTTGNLTITNCTVSGNSTAGYVAAGGGVYASGDVTLTNTTLSGNHTTGYGAPGGGIYTYGNVTLTNSAVSGNSTAGKYAAGGGISTYGAVTLTGSTVSGNQTLGESANGGGVNSSGDVILSHSAVNGNHTEGINGSGGGIGSQGDVILNNSTVSGNHTLGLTAVGGGIANFGNVTLSTSTVSGNHTHGEGASGGGIRANSSITLLNSTVSGNYTTGLGATGGGVWAGDNVTLTSSTASGNHTGGDYAWGGGSFSYGNLTLTSSTISGNHTAGIFANGAGAMLGEYGALTLLNSILAGNTAVDGRPDIWMVGSVPPNLHYSLVGNNFGAALLIPAPLGSPDANGNLIGTTANPIDPMLRPLADNGGPTLPDGRKILTQSPLSGSPVINSGDPAAMAGVGGVPFYDQRGTPWSRVGGGRIDRGALELQSNPLTGDYNFSGVVDAADYTVYRDTLGSTIDLRADGSGNGSVGPEDYGVWKMHFGETLPPGAGSGSLASTVAEFVAPSVERAASDRVSRDQVFLASDGDDGRLAVAPHFALDAHARPTIHLRRGASYVVDAISAAAARQDHALLAWVASATRAVPDDGSSDLYRQSTPSPSESLPDCRLGVLDAAFGLLNGQ